MKQIILAVILLFSSMSIFVEQDVPFLTTKNYDEHVSQDGVVAVEFWAEWNSEESYNLCDLENVKAYRVDVDEEYMLVSRFRVNNVPTLFIYKDGILRHKETSDVTFEKRAHIDLLQDIINNLNKTEK